jgi:hypothetical protein
LVIVVNIGNFGPNEVKNSKCSENS